MLAGRHPLLVGLLDKMGVAVDKAGWGGGVCGSGRGGVGRGGETDRATWDEFLKRHAANLWAYDFFTR